MQGSGLAAGAAGAGAAGGLAGFPSTGDRGVGDHGTTGFQVPNTVCEMSGKAGMLIA